VQRFIIILYIFFLCISSCKKPFKCENCETRFASAKLEYYDTKRKEIQILVKLKQKNLFDNKGFSISFTYDKPELNNPAFYIFPIGKDSIIFEPNILKFFINPQIKKKEVYFNIVKHGNTETNNDDSLVSMGPITIYNYETNHRIIGKKLFGNKIFEPQKGIPVYDDKTGTFITPLIYPSVLWCEYGQNLELNLLTKYGKVPEFFCMVCLY
jgi:hypothetical protein